MFWEVREVEREPTADLKPTSPSHREITHKARDANPRRGWSPEAATSPSYPLRAGLNPKPFYRYSNSLLGGVPLSPTRSSAQEFQVAVHSKFGVGLTCLAPFADSTPKSKASPTSMAVALKLSGAPGGGT